MGEDFTSYEATYHTLLDPAAPLDSRFRELYRVKSDLLHTPAGAHLIAAAVDTTDSVLLQHELVYNLGQSGVPAAVPPLVRILREKEKYNLVTRHEAAEALGALGEVPAEALEALAQHASPETEPSAGVRESCELALRRLQLPKHRRVPPPGCPFVSLDPAPAFAADGKEEEEEEGEEGEVPREGDVPALQRILCDDSGATSLWRRYKAMFTLRNIGTKEAVEALSVALRSDTASALFRHEVAFVLGQLEHRASIDALCAALKDEEEAPMVRHEAAEALGAMADPALLPILESYAKHEEPLVRDSCVVALEMHRYWSNFTKKPQQEESNTNTTTTNAGTTITVSP
ncbi:uncharacterized protein TM35_000021950 [Trypanosoma theileri]|uniref:Deoxyhypusine hydroxylase n=1 Tax=Trypanosoma theileri TaxID=67003 RepID=A0A1X0P8G1_9TRYP|nr:uncharacterized protein TM35_000021950 [Trypanosoma theileri]ORC92869.1 hypothetical protein TM35_000021950 [Trypanosoma theileri]